MTDRPLFSAPLVRATIRPCPCERLCGGFQLEVVSVADGRYLSAADARLFDHLGAGEALDVIDAYAFALSQGDVGRA